MNTMEHEVDPLKAQKPKKTTLKARYKSVMENVTIEPLLACSTIPTALARLATQNLNLDKACRLNLKYGDEVCEALIAREGEMYRTEEIAVQELISGMEIWQNFLYSALPCILILFIGAWSDRTGRRKICILLPIVGNLLTCISNIVNTYFFYELPLELCMFLEAFCPSITGGWVTMYMGAFSYISDISSAETRTFRFGIATLCATAGRPIGTALSGILLKKIGYYGVFSISSVLYIFSIIYGIYYIEDPKLPIPKEDSEDKGFLKAFFDLKHVKDTATVVLKKGPNQRRIKSIMVLLCLLLIDGPNVGDFTVRYLYCRYRFNWDAVSYSYYMTFYIVLHAFGDFTVWYLYSRYRFNWDAVVYGFYMTFYMVLHAFGALVSISIFSRKFQWDDSVLGLISTISRIAGALATGLAQNSFQMYLGVVIETFNATSYTALRSICSKLVSSEEMGKIQSVFNLTCEVASLVAAPLYSWMYMVTLKHDAGLVYYVSAAITVSTVFIFGWFYKVNKKSTKKRKSIVCDNCEDIKDENEQLKSNAKKKEEDPVICNMELTDHKIIIQ